MTLEISYDTILLELLFETNLSNREIAAQLAVPVGEVSKRIKELGLGWVRRSQGHASRGQAALTAMLRKLLPGEEVVSEYPIGEKLKLDIYCPRYQLALEFHGRQHFDYVEFFHKDAQGFDEHYQRDMRKALLCAEIGIVLIVFRYDDLLTEDVVFNRILEALEQTKPPPDRPRRTIKGNPYYEAIKQRQREYRKLSYRKMKRRDGNRN